MPTLPDRLRALGELLERDHLIVAHIENFKHWPANAHVIDDVYEAARVVENAEKAALDGQRLKAAQRDLAE